MAVSGRSNRLRTQVAQLAAKLIAVEGVADFKVAKRKAAQRLGLRPDHMMPTNVEVQEALQEYQRIFQQETHMATQDRLRRTAVQAMTLLKGFRPLLAGPVLEGTATLHSEVAIHVYCDVAEELSLFLDEYGIPFQSSSRTINMAGDGQREMAAYRFLAGSTPMILVVFTESDRACVPLSPLDGRPMQRAQLEQVEALLNPRTTTS